MRHFVLDKNTMHEFHFRDEDYSLCHGQSLTFPQFTNGVLFSLNNLFRRTGSFSLTCLSHVIISTLISFEILTGTNHRLKLPILIFLNITPKSNLFSILLERVIFSQPSFRPLDGYEPKGSLLTLNLEFKLSKFYYYFHPLSLIIG